MLRVVDRADPADVAVIAEDEARARARRDDVVPCTAHDNGAAGADRDVVVAADRRRDRPHEADGDRECAERRRVVGQSENLAVVAENDVRARAAGDQVAARTADDDVVAGAEVDGVRGAIGGRDRGCPEHDGHAIRCAPVEAAVVAEHDVRAGAEIDGVLASAADHDLPAAAGLDGVVAAGARRAALDVREGQRQARELRAAEWGAHDHARVAEHDVRLRPELDRVVAGAADDDVAAGVGGDLVVAADAGCDRARLGDLVHAGLLRPLNVAAVAEREVRAPAEVDPVVRVSAEDDVVAVRHVDLIVTADRRVDRDGKADEPVDAVVAVVGAAVAEDGEREPFEHEQLGVARPVDGDRGQDRPGREVQDASPVAEDDVVAGADEDVVGVLAAEDHERQG